MSDDPAGTEFGVSDQGVQDFAASLGGAASLADAFPAVLLAPVWQAMLKAGVVVAPPRVAVDRAEVRLVDPNVLELRVPVSTVYGELVNSVTVYADRWLATGELAIQVADEARRLAHALELADANSVFVLTPGQGQKPHN
jgi:hypothetical protein